MSYSLYLRRPQPIRAEELEGASELVLWLESGEVEYRGGREEDIPALLRLAEQLGAPLVGDDGEIYPLSENPPRPPRRRSWRERIREKLTPRNSPFQVGDRVRDLISGREGTVLELVGGPLPKVRVRYADGKETLRALESSGLEKI